MNLSLKKRVGFSFVVATLVTVFLSITVYYHLATMHDRIEVFNHDDNLQNLTLFEIRVNVLSIIKAQRKIILQRNKVDKEAVTTLVKRVEELNFELGKLEVVYPIEKVRLLISKMKGGTDSLAAILQKTGWTRRGRSFDIVTISTLTDNLLDNLTEILSVLSKQSQLREEKLQKILIDTKRYMMITLIIGFLSTIILGLVIPGKIALPFKKIKDAIRELQECNFDVSIYYEQNDEIGEIAKEMNKMIHGLKVFEELRADRISVENRRFDALANMVKRPVLVADTEGHIVYMNNRIYNILQVQSEDVIGKEMSEKFVPRSIISCFELAIKRRTKIENEEVIIKKKLVAELLSPEPVTALMEEEHDEAGPKEIVEPVEAKVETIYNGFANIIPIRGKSSAQDYYLMVLSTEVFS